MNTLLTKFGIFSISLAVGIGLTFMWSTFGRPATQELDAIIVDAGARLLGAVSARNDVSSYERGRIEARRDVEKGVFILKSFGWLDVPRNPYSDLLTREYGIEFLDYGCVVTQEFANYVQGYNEVSRTAIEHRFGKGILAFSVRAER